MRNWIMRLLRFGRQSELELEEQAEHEAEKIEREDESRTKQADVLRREREQTRRMEVLEELARAINQRKV